MINSNTCVESAIIGRNAALFREQVSRFAYAMPLVRMNTSIQIDRMHSSSRSPSSTTHYESVDHRSNRSTDEYVSVHPRRIETKISKASIVTSLRSIPEVIPLFVLHHDLSFRATAFHCRGLTYYQVNTLDSRISNIDQLLTQDVEKFCNSVADLYTNISKVISSKYRLTRFIVTVAFSRYYDLRSKTIRIDWDRRSIVVGAILNLLGIPADQVRWAWAHPSFDSDASDPLDYVDRSDP
jgi:hypothetical protein